MDKGHIAKRIEAQAKDKRLACKQALKIAEEEGISSKELGQMLNDMEIKVVSCQLGCFG
jgi:hypothetical protein